MNDPRKVSQIILAGGALIQVILVLSLVIAPLASNIWHVRDLPKSERSARLAFGDNFAEFIDFVREHVPDDATVIIPYEETDIVFGNVGIMQYFLFPREIADCAHGAHTSDCIVSMAGPKVYFLSVADFPPAEAMKPTNYYILFEGDKGLYIPRP